MVRCCVACGRNISGGFARSYIFEVTRFFDLGINPSCIILNAHINRNNVNS